MQQLISVILSTYNEETPFIEESVNSILHQTHENLELILINDNPQREDLHALLSRYAQQDSRVNYVINPENLGLVGSLNKGIGLARGEYIARMDADDISDGTRLEKQLAYLQEHQLDLVGACITKIDEQGQTIGVLDLPVKEKNIRHYLKWGSCLLHPTWLCRKSLYTALGGYRNIAGAEDYDFVLRAVLSGHRVGNVDQRLLRYRIRESSISVSNSARQQLTANLLAKEYAHARVCGEQAIAEMYRSEKYARDLQKLQSYQSLKQHFAQSKQLTLGIRLCTNPFFYRSAIQHFMKKHYTQAGK